MATLPGTVDPRWARLRAATPARIGLQRAGSTISTAEHLAFQLAHAQARDAVVEHLDVASIEDGLRRRHLECIRLHSAASDRQTYLARPDLGRCLDPASRDRLARREQDYDLVFVLADGLAARAIARHALPLLDRILPMLSCDSWRIGPIAVVEEGRVAIGDEVGQILNARLVAVLIGERPGLSAPDSLGIYLTWTPVVGRTDAERNCLSNIRPEGMTYGEAAQRLFYLCTEARRRQLSGVKLKDETGLAETMNEELIVSRKIE
jgi:ethanolamine ammonia-lyase small subunit